MGEEVGWLIEMTPVKKKGKRGKQNLPIERRGQ